MQTTKRFQVNAKQVFILLLALQLIYMLIASFNAGISADEFRHYDQAKKVYNFYSTLGKDKSALESTGRDPMQLNGQSFDNLMYLFEKIFNVNDFMALRHFFNALTGWLIILITGLIVKKIAGFRAAIFAAVVLFFSPRFLGHAMNNNKDIPFAFGFMLSMLGIILFLKQLPKPKWPVVAILILGIASAVSVRIAGLLSIVFLVFYSGLYYLLYKPVSKKSSEKKTILLKKIALYIIPVSIAGYFLGILFWPYLLEAPVSNLKTVLTAMSLHPLAMNQLFEGKLFLSNTLPWYYTFKYIWISYPSVVLTGILLFCILIFKFRRQYNYLWVFAIFFPFVFTVLWMSVKNSNVYGGIRHILFIYPLAVVICSLGFDMLLGLAKNYNRKPLVIGCYIFPVLLLIHPVRHILVNYPYAYVYFNELSGGVNKNWKDYETDYFQHSLRHSTKWLINNELNKITKNDSIKIKIITNDARNVGYYLRGMEDKVESEYSRFYEKASKKWDYAIFYLSYITPLQLQNNLWPPVGTIHTEKVDNAVIAAVVKRPTQEDYLGFKEMEKMNLEKAMEHFENALKIMPENEEVLAAISRVYLLKRDFPKAIEFADKSLRYTPDYMMGLYHKAIALNETKDFKGALALAQRMTAIKSDLPEGYFQKALAYYGMGMPNEAMVEMQKTIGFRKEYYDAYMFYGQILINQRQYRQAIENVYSRVLRIRENDFTAQVKIAQCQYFLKNTGAAQEMLMRLRTVNPTHFEVVKLACRIGLDRNDLQEAYNNLIMLRNVNDNSEVSVLRALFFMKVNDPESARKSAEEAVNLDRNNLEAVQLLQTFSKPASAESVMKEPPKQKIPGLLPGR